MGCRGSQPLGNEWLIENGPKKLELLLRAIVYHRAQPIVIADSDRRYRDASTGAGKLLGVSREAIIGRSLDGFVKPSFKPEFSELWEAFLEKGEQAGTLPLVDASGHSLEVEYTAKGHVLPVRHLVMLRDKSAGPANAPRSAVPAWVYDYAFFLLNVDGKVVDWYSGAERLLGYSAVDVIGSHAAMFSSDEVSPARLQEALSRSAAAGHFANEFWCVRKDGNRFWGNVITLALRDENGDLQGFARVVRDFTRRREQQQKLLSKNEPLLLPSTKNAIPGIVSGEFDRIREANDTFLKLIGYTREDLAAGRLNWPDLTTPEHAALDELAHEEALRFGAGTPFERELIRKDGTRIPVLAGTAVLNLSPLRWITFIKDLRERDREESLEQASIEVRSRFEEIVGNSASLMRLMALVELVAPTNATVLVLGETGTGKELVARAIHRLSPRRDRPFITLNCAAIPTGLLESELFGYERGAFTGALSQKIGRFEVAHKGTLFLDEVGDIPLELQPKLLRALQEKTFERLGGTKTIPIDVRLVAATNRNLTQMMGDKLFRSDLYYRLNVFPITTTPLRDHPEDIPALARHFTKKYARAMNKQIDKIPSETMSALVACPWRGNVRELENFIERAVILSPGRHLESPLSEIRSHATEPAPSGSLAHVEREHILQVLRETRGVISQAAIRLGIPRTTLNAMMGKLGVSRIDL